jgi:hypothetical protein
MVNLTVSGGENWVGPDSSFIAPEDGQYDITFRCLLDNGCGDGSKAMITNGVEFYTNQTVAVGSFFGSVDKIMTTSANVFLTKGQKLFFGVVITNNRNTVLTPSAPPMVSIVLLQQKVPTIIANKGALLSSDDMMGVNFDANGIMKVNQSKTVTNETIIVNYTDIVTQENALSKRLLKIQSSSGTVAPLIVVCVGTVNRYMETNVILHGRFGKGEYQVLNGSGASKLDISCIKTAENSIVSFGWDTDAVGVNRKLYVILTNMAQWEGGIIELTGSVGTSAPEISFVAPPFQQALPSKNLIGVFKSPSTIVNGTSYYYSLGDLSLSLVRSASNGYLTARVGFNNRPTVTFDWKDINWYDSAGVQNLGGRETVTTGNSAIIDNDIGYAATTSGNNVTHITVTVRDSTPEVYVIDIYPWGLVGGSASTAGVQGYTVKIEKF